jgi:O-antigen ligase
LHGIAGEPRDAFVHMIAIVFIFGLKSLWNSGQVSLSKALIVTIVFCLLATQSGSGILGLIIALMLITIFGFNRISLKRIANVLLLMGFGGAVVYIAFLSSERLQLYLTYAAVVQELFLDSSIDVPLIVQTQYNNIYPIIELYRDVLEFNPIPVLFGSGLGSSGFANSRTLVFDTLTNPHSQITRTIFEAGLLGTFIFIYAFRKMLLNSTNFLSRINQQRLLWLFLLLLGCYFAHRSTHLVICTGVLYCVTQAMRKRSICSAGRT